MIRARWHRTARSCYLVIGPYLHQTLEVGYNLRFNTDRPFSVGWRFRTKGDHAGLQASVAAFGCLAELNLCDQRHWNHEADRFYLPGEEER